MVLRLPTEVRNYIRDEFMCGDPGTSCYAGCDMCGLAWLFGPKEPLMNVFYKPFATILEGGYTRVTVMMCDLVCAANMRHHIRYKNGLLE